jgi:hypothetical protein
MKRLYIPLLFILPVFCFSQAFGFEDEDTEKSFLPFNLEFSGDITAGPLLFVKDFTGGISDYEYFWGDIFESNLNIDISGKNAQAFVSLNFSYWALKEFENADFKIYPPSLLNEVWLRGYFDRLTVQTGLMKLRWGKMYSPGPLDVVNPFDYSDLTNLSDPWAMKIARPIVHASYKTGDFSAIEAVFLPNFAGHRFETDGRWTPGLYSKTFSDLKSGIITRAVQRYPIILALFTPEELSAIQDTFNDSSYEFPATSTIDYFQAGLRFNTVIGPCDIGFQYFYGNYMRPSVSINDVDGFLDGLVSSFLSGVSEIEFPSVRIEYSRYHQIGVDYSQVIFGFNARAEFAAHITNDLRGDNGNIKNPFLSWAVGFDRDIFAGININVQCSENIRLFNDKVGKNPAMDCEAGTDFISTRLILRISKSFFREKLECNFVSIWDIEDSGCVIIPSVVWVLDDTRIELSSGIFTGDKESEMGQYYRNSYIKLKMSYSF